jgi:3-hydroxyisobutyrate dehydrogenase-like beta-hydroxyacid dehydrogenase
MIAVSAGMMAEALSLARRGDIDWQDMLKLMENSAVGSPMVKYKCAPLKERDFTATFSGRQMAKDLDLILDCARGVGVPTPLAAQMRETYSAIIASGDGDADYIATVRHEERLAGLGDAAAAAKP